MENIYQSGGGVQSPYVPMSQPGFYQDLGVIDVAKAQRARYDKGFENYSRMNMALESFQSLEDDQSVLNNLRSGINKRMDDFVGSGAYELADVAVAESMTDMVNPKVMNVMTSYENYQQGEKAKAEARANGKLYYDFDNVPILDPNGNVIGYEPRAKRHNTERDGIYQTKFEEQGDIATRAKQLIDGIKADDYQIKRLAQSAGLLPEEVLMFLNKPSGISQSKIDKIAETLLPLLERTEEGEQLTRVLTQLETSPTTGKLHDPKEAKNVLLGHLISAAAPQRHSTYDLVQNPYTMAMLENSGKESVEGTDLLYTESLDPNNEAAAAFAVDEKSIFDVKTSMFGDKVFDNSGKYAVKKSGVGDASVSAGIVYDNILKEVGYDLSKLNKDQLERLEAHSNDLVPWIMEKSSWSKPDVRSKFVKTVNGKQVPMNDAEFARNVLGIMKRGTKVYRAEFQPGHREPLAYALANTLQGTDQLLILDKNGTEIAFGSKDFDDDLGNMYNDNPENLLNELRIGLNNVAGNKSDPGVDGDNIPKAYISYNALGSNVGSIHVKGHLSNGNTVEFDYTPFANQKNNTGTKYMKIIQDMVKSGVPGRKEVLFTAPNPHESAFITNIIPPRLMNPNIPVSVTFENVLSQRSDGEYEIVPALKIYQGNVLLKQETGWGGVEELSSISMNTLLKQNNVLGHGLNAQKDIRER